MRTRTVRSWGTGPLVLASILPEFVGHLLLGGGRRSMSIFGRRRGRIAGLALSTALLVGGLPALHSASAAAGSSAVGMVATYDTVTKKTNGYMIAKADGTVEPHGSALL